MGHELRAERFVYVVEARLGRKGKRTRRDHWEPLVAFVTFAEAEVYLAENEWRFFHKLRVTRVPLAGRERGP